MTRIEVRLYANLRQYVPAAGSSEPLRLEFASGATVRELIDRLKLPAEEVKRVFVNYRAVPDEYVLQDGDRVGIFPLVAGG